MRVCPKCRFMDPREWKHAKWSYHIDTISSENFAILYPKLSKQLKRPLQIIEDELYIYRLVKTGLVVQRKAKCDFGNYKGLDDLDFQNDGENYEAFNHKRITLYSNPKSPESSKLWRKWHPEQTKLFEVSK